jgi:hypothetical protein
MVAEALSWASPNATSRRRNPSVITTGPAARSSGRSPLSTAGPAGSSPAAAAASTDSGPPTTVVRVLASYATTGRAGRSTCHTSSARTRASRPLSTKLPGSDPPPTDGPKPVTGLRPADRDSDCRTIIGWVAPERP